MPHTPHTPGGAAATHPLTPGGPPSVSSIYNETNNNSNINANHSSPAQNQSPQHKSNMNNQNLMDNLSSNTLANSRNTGSLVNLSVDLNSDLNFDPAAVIDGNSTNDLNVSGPIHCAGIGLFNKLSFITIIFLNFFFLPFCSYFQTAS